MEHDGSMGRVLRFCEWVMRFAYTNLLWLFFTMIGLGVFGIMPATAALFAVMRKWIQGQDNVPVLQTFWREYKAEFLRSNLIGAVLAVIGLIIYIDLAFIYPSHFLLHVLRFAIMIFGFLFISMLFYVFPLLVHFDWKKRLYVKFSLLLSVAYLQYTLVMFALTVALFFLLAYLPGIVPFFSVSLISYCHMRMVYAVLLKVEQQHGEPQRIHQTREALYPETR
ncbi:YesL family protein [Bacillus inaquosorum]|uniref:YesL family protein n=1 Tax=Bacillus inaquosorum TaxID=483913 RepID=UPI0002E0394A|nr:YesL family protein [Bacillus inaquosorum]MED4646773.1 YesL family protein [Bacillus inaquosorum]MED4790127.1 YesL family protein [Bacillus inaquosorum]